MDWSFAVAIAGAVVSTIVIIATIIILFQSREARFLQRMTIDRVDYLTRDLLEAKEGYPSIADEKKGEIQKIGPKTFYFIDESQVKDLYLQLFPVLEPKRIETREAKEVKGGVKGKLKIVEPEYQRGKAEEIKKIYEIETIPALMYNKVEKYFFDKGSITFGLDEFEYDKSSIDEFKSMCNKMKEQFNLNISDEVQTTFVSDKMREFALKHILNLSITSGYVALQNLFYVTDISRNICLLSYEHTLNRYLKPEDGNVKIQISCADKYLTPSGSSTFTKDKSVRITCFGKIVSWSDKEKVLLINPVAIY
jgi:hypothetical protein